jgi:hypothetical protein
MILELIFVNTALNRFRIVGAVLLERGLLRLNLLVGSFGLEFFNGIPSGGAFRRSGTVDVASLTSFLALFLDFLVNFVVAHGWIHLANFTNQTAASIKNAISPFLKTSVFGGIEALPDSRYLPLAE